MRALVYVPYPNVGIGEAGNWARITGSKLPGNPGWDHLGPDGGPINQTMQTNMSNATSQDRKIWTAFAIAALRSGKYDMSQYPGTQSAPGPTITLPDAPFWRSTPERQADKTRFMSEANGYTWSTTTTTYNPLTIVENVPILGDIVKIVGEAAAAPFDLAIAIGSGARLDHALVGALKQQLKIVKDVAPYAQTIVSLVPGLGTGVAAMIGAGAALAEGKSIDDIAIAAIRGAIPGGAASVAAFDVATKVAKGENVAQAAIQGARDLLPPGPAQKAFDVGVAVATGQKIQTALANGLMSLAPGQLQNIIAAGKAAVASVPGLTDAIKTLSGPATDGFRAAAALLASTGLNEKSLVALRNQLTADQRTGFDAALKSQTKTTPWLVNVTNPAPTTSVPVLQDPKKKTTVPIMADPKKKSAYAPYPKKAGVAGVGAIPVLRDPVPRTRTTSYAPYPKSGVGAIPILRDPTPKTHVPTLVDPGTRAASAYAPYPKAGVGVGSPWWENWRDEWDYDIQTMKNIYLAAPPHGHPGGGHPFAARPHGRGGGQPDFWYGVPWSPSTVDASCRTWGPAIAIPPPMQTAARVALNVSKGQPTAAQGPDNVLYLFSIENGAMTARPCAQAGGALSGPAVPPGGGGTVQWFYIQTLSQNPSGGTATQYNGPFYGNPQELGGLLESGENVLTYYNGKWSQYLFN